MPQAKNENTQLDEDPACAGELQDSCSSVGMAASFPTDSQNRSEYCCVRCGNPVAPINVGDSNAIGECENCFLIVKLAVRLTAKKEQGPCGL